MWARFILDLVRSSSRAGGRAASAWSLPKLVFYADRSADPVLPPDPAAGAVGAVALDFGWSLTMLCVIILMTLVNLLLR